MQKRSLVIFSLIVISVLFIAGCQETVGKGFDQFNPVLYSNVLSPSSSGTRSSSSGTSSSPSVDYSYTIKEVIAQEYPNGLLSAGGVSASISRYGRNFNEHILTQYTAGSSSFQADILRGSFVYNPSKNTCWRVLDYGSLFASLSGPEGPDVKDIQGNTIFIYVIVPENEIACAQQSANQIKSFTEEDFARAIKL